MPERDFKYQDASKIKCGSWFDGLRYAPPFTARPMASHFRYEEPLVSPKGEIFKLNKSWNMTVALAEKPFSLLSKLKELTEMGLKYAIIDLSHQKITKKEIEEISRDLSGRKSRRKLSTFNYNGKLM